MRSRICCCKPCLGRNWQNCELKVCLCTVTLYIRKYDLTLISTGVCGGADRGTVQLSEGGEIY